MKLELIRTARCNFFTRYGLGNFSNQDHFKSIILAVSVYYMSLLLNYK